MLTNQQVGERKLKEGRKETACGISSLFLFNRSSTILTWLSFSLSPAWWMQGAELDTSAKVTRSESVCWNWPLWMSFSTLFRWRSFPPQQSYCYGLSNFREQPCISLVVLNVFMPFLLLLLDILIGWLVLVFFSHKLRNINVLKESFNSADIIWTEKKIPLLPEPWRRFNLVYWQGRDLIFVPGEELLLVRVLCGRRWEWKCLPALWQLMGTTRVRFAWA